MQLKKLVKPFDEKMNQLKNSIPNLTDFLISSIEEISTVAPKTLILAIGGTRRALALAGEPLENLAVWTRPQMLNACSQLFRYGVENLIVPIARPQQFAEGGLYRERLIEWINWGIAGQEALEYYRSANWRVRLTVAGNVPDGLINTIPKVDAATHAATGPKVWFLVVPDYEEMWQWQIHPFVVGAKTRKDAIAQLFGDDLPVADVLLSFGKSMISLDILPPILYDEIQCYWTQKPGYAISEEMLRKIIYDYAYTRATWRHDKTGRSDEAIAQRAIWEQDQTLGLGVSIGPFWYPSSFSSLETIEKTSDISK